jgi:hypothetical protein
MAWEVYERVVRRSTVPRLTISKLGRISFNAAATDTLAKSNVSHVLLLWDREARKVGVRAVGKKDSRSYSVHYAAKNASAGFAAKTFLDFIHYNFSKTQGFLCHWNDKESTFEAEILAEHFTNKPIHRFPREYGGKKGSEAHSQAKATNA